MESKIQISVTCEGQSRIKLQWKASEDVRDELVAMFIRTGAPDPDVLDGYCRLSHIGKTAEGLLVELLPIHPIDMLKHIDLIKENADKFKTFQG